MDQNLHEIRIEKKKKRMNEREHNNPKCTKQESTFLAGEDFGSIKIF